MRAWPAILLKSSIATLFSIAGSLLLAVTLVPALGGVVDGNAWLMCVLCPLVVAFPASTWQFRQAERLRAANAEIERLHDELFQAYAALTKAHGHLTERARRDGLTGLLNRESFFEALRIATVSEPPGVLLVIDADRFKQINDSFGHPLGDEALSAMAGVVAGVVGPGRPTGRIGGEEFAVYLSDMGLEQAGAVAERIRRLVTELKLVSERGDRVALSVSIGGAPLQKTDTPATLFAEADRQLYNAKRRGRDRVEFTSRGRAVA